jgi:hypothetical protein
MSHRVMERDSEVLGVSTEACDLVMSDLSPRLTDANRDAVSAEVADAIASMVAAGQTNIERLRTYAYSRGLEASMPGGRRRAKPN